PVPSCSYASAAHPHLHSFPTRRSSDLEIFGRKDLTGANTVRDLANAWKGQNGLSEDLFRDIMRRVVYDVIQRWRAGPDPTDLFEDRKSTRLNSSHVKISYAVFCLKKKK